MIFVALDKVHRVLAMIIRSPVAVCALLVVALSAQLSLGLKRESVLSVTSNQLQAATVPYPRFNGRFQVGDP